MGAFDKFKAAGKPKIQGPVLWHERHRSQHPKDMAEIDKIIDLWLHDKKKQSEWPKTTLSRFIADQFKLEVNSDTVLRYIQKRVADANKSS